MDARKQFHVARRLGPVVGQLVPLGRILKEREEKKASDEEVTQEELNKILETILEPLLSSVADMSDERADYIIDACLDHVEVKQDSGLGWARLRMNGVVMYPLDLLGLFSAVRAVVEDNLGGFIDAQSATGKAEAASKESHG
jgi:hypothetical protein